MTARGIVGLLGVGTYTRVHTDGYALWVRGKRNCRERERESEICACDGHRRILQTIINGVDLLLTMFFVIMYIFARILIERRMMNYTRRRR